MFDVELSDITKLYDGNKYDDEELFNVMGSSSNLKESTSLNAKAGGGTTTFTKKVDDTSNQRERPTSKTARAYSHTRSSGFVGFTPQSERSRTLGIMKQKMQASIKKKGFCDVLIRDKS